MVNLREFNIVPLKNSPYIQQTFDHMDRWKTYPQNSNILTAEGDMPMHMWSTKRPSAREFNEIMDSPFSFPDMENMICHHYVGLDSNNQVIGYFHFNELRTPLFLMNAYCGYPDTPPDFNNVVVGATCVHCYNFSGGTYTFGKQQNTFYEYLTQEYDYVAVLIEAEGEWTSGDVLPNGTPTNDTYKSIVSKRIAETGFAHDGLLVRCQSNNGVMTPYCVNLPTNDGLNRFHHLVRWRSPKGIQKGMKQFPVQIYRPYELRTALLSEGFTEYY